MSEQVAEVAEDETTDVPEPDEPETTPEPEPDEDEPEAAAEPEPEPEPQPAPPAHGEAWWEKAWERSTAEDKRHADRVGAIFEEESQEFMQCPMCLAGPAGWLVSSHFTDEQLGLIHAVLGIESPDEYEPMEGAALCDKCKGKGKVRTPSLVEAEKIKPCMACNGIGWNYVAGPGLPTAPLVAPPLPTNGAEATTEEINYPDAWGRPAGHPHYGKLPSEVGA